MAGIAPILVLLLGLYAGMDEPEPRAWKGFRFIENPQIAMRASANTCRVRYFAFNKGRRTQIDPSKLIEIDEDVRSRHMIHHEMRAMCAQMAPDVDLRADISCNASMTGKRVVKPNHNMCKARRYPRTGDWRPGG